MDAIADASGDRAAEPRPVAVVGQLERDRVRVEAKPHVRVRRAGVLVDVGQRFGADEAERRAVGVGQVALALDGDRGGDLGAGGELAQRLADVGPHQHRRVQPAAQRGEVGLRRPQLDACGVAGEQPLHAPQPGQDTVVEPLLERSPLVVGGSEQPPREARSTAAVARSSASRRAKSSASAAAAVAAAASCGSAVPACVEGDLAAAGRDRARDDAPSECGAATAWPRSSTQPCLGTA